MNIVQRLSARTSYTKNFITVLNHHYGEGSVFLEVDRVLGSTNELTVLVLTEKTLDLATFNGSDPIESMSAPIDLHIESYPLGRVSRIKESYFTPRLAEDGIKQSARINFSLEIQQSESLTFSLLSANTFGEELFSDYFTFLTELKKRLN
jgi:hypothetical protein